MVRPLALLGLAAPAAYGAALALRPGLPRAATPLAQKGAVAALAGVYTVDPTHASVGFDVGHLGLSRVQGRLTDVTGKLVVDPRHLDKSSITLRIGVASVDTGVAARDAELRTKAFFDVATYPEILFVSKHIWRAGRDDVVIGDLTMRGVTQEVRLLVDAYGPVDVGTARGGVRYGLVSKPFRLDRRDYGIPYDVKLPSGIPVVDDEVNVRLSVEAVRDAAVPTPRGPL